MTQTKIGVLLVNLGTPDAPTVSAMKRYLQQFLSDPRVIDLPRLQWLAILNGIVIPRRAPKIAKLYQEIWTDQGSPLLAISYQQQQKIQDYFISQNQNVIVELAMTYGNPSIKNAVNNLLQQNIKKLIVLPLYPQYSSTTTAPVFDAFAQALKVHKKIVPFEFIHSYHDHPLYIEALVNSIQLDEKEHLLFSFHGIPKRYELEGDFYPQHCQETTSLVASKLNLTQAQFSLAFQSRFGKEEWLKPYTDKVLSLYPKQGIKNIAIICPGFSSDCLETLEEITNENRDIFCKNGGESYRYIPALNANDDHIKLLVALINAKI
ncbi:ferrochelatase [Pasteurella skyensis]|uniref:Ferrochelatase n=1 Tax=Phocoenobacter skyensis TaxID=97481 RepID=A0AAJ6N8F5_9PAST|nr:ferrochelatase [Pasteurella skyensis]MDP8161974.1 ferrochelatase [Pasteurella skyensis]MDP8170398.1 ferrochelatase [Pasteurella skyensis]MDP8172130.1 ferrochelatase [Pasteurella skyensis]MDP8175067.1 ferrochelatase [Pasteurella skyensis]MDP8176522.1 ferrochelatase [Pasteurella skyensis]